MGRIEAIPELHTPVGGQGPVPPAGCLPRGPPKAGHASIRASGSSGHGFREMGVRPALCTLTDLREGENDGNRKKSAQCRSGAILPRDRLCRR